MPHRVYRRHPLPAWQIEPCGGLVPAHLTSSWTSICFCALAASLCCPRHHTSPDHCLPPQEQWDGQEVPLQHEEFPEGSMCRWFLEPTVALGSAWAPDHSQGGDWPLRREMVFGTTLCLPGEFLTVPEPPSFFFPAPSGLQFFCSAPACPCHRSSFERGSPPPDLFPHVCSPGWPRSASLPTLHWPVPCAPAFRQGLPAAGGRQV